MTIKVNTAESAAAVNGDTANATSTAFSGNDAMGVTGSAGTRTFSTVTPYRGAKCYLLTPSGVSGQVGMSFTGFTGTGLMSATWLMRFDSMPTTAQSFCFMYTSASPAIRALVTELGMPRISDYAGATVTTGTTAMVAGRWYLMQAAFEVGTTTTNGKIKFKITDTTDGSTVYSLDRSDVNAGTGVTSANWQVGKMTTNTETTAIRIDDIIVSNETSALLPQLTAAPASPVYADEILSNTGWTSNGPVGSIPEGLRDALDTTYAQNTTTADAMVLGVENLLSGDRRIIARLSSTSGTPSVQIDLMEGASVRATRTQAITTTWTDYTFTLTAPENASVTDNNNLSVRVTAL